MKSSYYVSWSDVSEPMQSGDDTSLGSTITKNIKNMKFMCPILIIKRGIWGRSHNGLCFDLRDGMAVKVGEWEDIMGI